MALRYFWTNLFFVRKQIGLVFRLSQPRVTDCWTNDETATTK